MKSMIVMITITMILGGCASGNTKEAINIAVNRCPVLKKYTPQQMISTAKELRNLPSDSQVNALLTDYSKLRDACRIAETKLRAAVKKRHKQVQQRQL